MRPCTVKTFPCKLFAIVFLIALPALVFAQPENRPQATPTPMATPAPQASPAAETARGVQTPAEDEARGPRDPMSSPTFNGLRFRSVGPAFTSGRVIGFAVDPSNATKYFVASASGGVWRTINNGTRGRPFSIG